MFEGNKNYFPSFLLNKPGINYLAISLKALLLYPASFYDDRSTGLIIFTTRILFLLKMSIKQNTTLPCSHP